MRRAGTLSLSGYASTARVQNDPSPMILSHDGHTPRIDPSSRVAPNAIVCGDVEIGPNCTIGFGAVLTAESGPIRIGCNVVIMENAIVRGVRGQEMSLGDNVLIGPHASLSGCTIEDEVFVATGAAIFNGAIVGARAEIRINAVVHVDTNVPANNTVPIGWVAVGSPARIFPPSAHDELWLEQEKLNFPKVVFGVDRPKVDESMMSEVMPKYAGALRRLHSRDEEAS